MNRTFLAVVSVLGGWAVASPVLADTLLVPSEYATIQAGIDAAVDGDTVLVADGTYSGPGNRDMDFGGKAITVQSENGPAACIIDIAADENDPHRAFHFCSGEPAESVVAGFTIQNGFMDRGGGHSHYPQNGAMTKRPDPRRNGQIVQPTACDRCVLRGSQRY